jgi:chaperone BCS1
LTFSGLLNALDGVGASSGQMYILTTNLRDDLDPALVRNGRVDCQVRFDHATDEQIEKMWSAFYPPDTGGEGECKSETAAAAVAEGPGLAKAFCAAVRASLGGRPVACCALQHFFVTQRRRTATDALAAVGELVDDLRRREAEDAADQADKGEGEGEGEGKGEGKGKGQGGAVPGCDFVSSKSKKKGKKGGD